jgi:AcrR family transcriptional regulator
MEEFSRHGYDATKMDDIAARATISKPVLYDHFPSKRALFQATLESIRDRLIDSGRAVVNAPAAPETKFRHAIDAFLQFVEQEPHAARVLLMVPSGDPIAAKLSREVQAGASSGIAALLTSFMHQETPRRLQVTAEFLKEGLHAVAVWWLDHADVSREELVDAVTGIAWTGLQAEAQAARTRSDKP